MKELLKALLKSQMEINGLTKDAKGYGYNYMSLDSILNTVKPILNNNGIVLVQQVGAENNIISVKTQLYYAETGDCLESDYLKLDLNDSKILSKGNIAQEQGAAITYLKRYSLSLLGISVDEDNDANNIMQNNKSNQRSKQQNNKTNTNTTPRQNKATEEEIIELLTVAQTKGFNDAKVEKAAGKKLNLLTSEEVKALIERLNKK